MNIEKIILRALGVLVIIGAFLAVFGSSLGNLVVHSSVNSEQQGTPLAEETTSTSTPEEQLQSPSSITPQTKIVSRQSEGDDAYEQESDDDDDEGGSAATPQPKPTQSTGGSSGTTGTPASATSYTMAQIATHDSATSCWSAINGNVYNLTTWVDRHPGGRAAILMICGKDGSPLFNMQHGGQSKPTNILATFKIGSLKS